MKLIGLRIKPKVEQWFQAQENYDEGRARSQELLIGFFSNLESDQTRKGQAVISNLKKKMIKQLREVHKSMGYMNIDPLTQKKRYKKTIEKYLCYEDA